MDDMKVYNRAFISTCIAISIPFFVWGNTISHLRWIASKINMSHSTIGYFFMIFAIPAVETVILFGDIERPSLLEIKLILLIKLS